MKRGAVDHPKLQRLQRRLKLTRFQAMGLMEALWHFVGRYSPEGDIGRWADEEIAAWVEWDGDAEELIDTLVLCGWLDRDPRHRLLVHDWPDHADEATRIALKRAGKTFCVATPAPELASQAPAEDTCRDTVATLSGPPRLSHALPCLADRPAARARPHARLPAPEPDLLPPEELPGGWLEQASAFYGERHAWFEDAVGPRDGPQLAPLLDRLAWFLERGRSPTNDELDAALEDARGYLQGKQGPVPVRTFVTGLQRAMEGINGSSGSRGSGRRQGPHRGADAAGRGSGTPRDERHEREFADLWRARGHAG